MGSENPRFSGWYSCITNNEKRRKAEHSYKKGLIAFWKCYEADNVIGANEVEAYFHKKGTKNSPHGHGAKKHLFLYIFLNYLKQDQCDWEGHLLMKTY